MTTNALKPVWIEPDAFYHDGQVRLLLGITSATLARARKQGRLRFARQGKRTLYRGSWLLEWLELEADVTREGRRRE